MNIISPRTMALITPRTLAVMTPRKLKEGIAWMLLPLRAKIILSFLLFILFCLPLCIYISKLERADIYADKLIALRMEELVHKEEIYVTVIIDSDHPNDFGGIQSDLEYMLNDLHIDNSFFIFTVQVERLSKVCNDDIMIEGSTLDDCLLPIATSAASKLHSRSYTMLVKRLENDDCNATLNLTMGRYRHGWMKYCFRNQQHVVPGITEFFHDYIISLLHHPKGHSFPMAYRLSFSLINEDPNSKLIEWDFASVGLPFLSPFIDAVSPLATFNVESNVAYFVSPTDHVNTSPDGSFFYITTKELKVFLSSYDWGFGTLTEARESPIHFLIHMPPASKTPLFVTQENLSDDSQTPKLNNFFVPRWGGVAILNLLNVSAEQGRPFTLTSEYLESPMTVFHTQLRLLLGMSPSSVDAKASRSQTVFHFIPCPDNGVTQWELDASIRTRIAYFTNESLKTLQGLAKLVTKMTHMVVKESVKQNVDKAFVHLQFVKDCLQSQPQHITEALHHAKNALLHSELAFFDPSMVPQMYFPDKNIFAVYSPLVMPLVIPIARGVVVEAKRLRWRYVNPDLDEPIDMAMSNSDKIILSIILFIIAYYTGAASVIDDLY